MRILAVAPFSHYRGGAERSFLMVLRTLRDEFGVHVDVLVPRARGEFNEMLDREGIAWFTYFHSSSITHLKGDRLDLLRMARVKAQGALERLGRSRLFARVARGDYDLVYTNSDRPVVGALVARSLGIPHVVHVRNIDRDGHRWGYWSARDVYEMSDRVIFCSDAARDEFGARDEEGKAVTVHNGIDLDPDLGAGRPQGLRPEGRGLNLVLTGRLIPSKGHREAIAGVALASAMGCTDLRLDIVGGPPYLRNRVYARELRMLVERLRLSDSVVFHGDVREPNLIREGADCELMCSELEAFGRVTVEGMRRGLLVIGANTGGTREIVRDRESGLLYRQGDPQSLAEAIAWVYFNREKAHAVAAEGFRFSRANFTPAQNVGAVHSVFESVLEGARA